MESTNDSRRRPIRRHTPGAPGAWAAVLLCLALAAPALAGEPGSHPHSPSKGDGTADLRNPYLVAAMKQYRNFEYEAALENLRKASFMDNLQIEDLHICLYKGLLQLELGQGDAVASFKAALEIDENAALPANAPPKAKEVFDRARRELRRSPSSAPSAVERAAPPAQGSRPLLAAGLVLDGVGVATLVGAILCDALAVKDNDRARTLAASGDRPGFDEAAQGFRTKRTAAATLYGIGGAVAITGLILSLWPESDSGAHAALSPVPGGATFVVGGAF